jgi:hypothetical protein
MGQELTDGGAGFWRFVGQSADRIVEREVAFFDAAQHQRRREQLRDAVDLERRVGTRRNRALHVLATERLLPRCLAGSQDGCRQARDAGLAAKGVQVIGETQQHEVVGGADKYACRQQDSGRDR